MAFTNLIGFKLKIKINIWNEFRFSHPERRLEKTANVGEWKELSDGKFNKFYDKQRENSESSASFIQVLADFHVLEHPTRLLKAAGVSVKHKKSGQHLLHWCGKPKKAEFCRESILSSVRSTMQNFERSVISVFNSPESPPWARFKIKPTKSSWLKSKTSVRTNWQAKNK